MKLSIFKILYLIRLTVELIILGFFATMCVLCWINLNGTPISQLTLTQIIFMTYPLWLGIFIQGYNKTRSKGND